MISVQETVFQAEDEGMRKRALAYIYIRIAFDLILLPAILLAANAGGRSPAIWVLIADGLGLLVYWLAVRRWPTASTYLALIYTALLIIALDFALSSALFFPWLFLIPLSFAGGIIIARPGFNSLVTLSILTIFVAYLVLLFLNRLTLSTTMSNELLFAFVAALGLVLLFLNALTEVLVVQQFHSQQTLLSTRLQLLDTLRELERRKYQLSDIQRETRQVERRSAIGQIASQLSKSLRAPLDHIDKTLALPQDTLCKPETISELQAEVTSALRLTDNLEHFARLDQLHIQTVNLDDLLADELAQIQLSENVTLQIHQPLVFPPIQADREQMRLLIHHLLDNAFQAVRGGGEISVTLEPSPEGIRLEVADTGSGIPEDQVPLIFEPLYTTQQQRFGLGLAICQQIVQMQGGDISVDTKMDEGARFCVNLPRVPRHPPGELAQDVAG